MFKIHHINEEENVLISGTREKSAVGDSAKPKQQAGRLLFQFRQLLHERWYFTRGGDFNARKDFTIHLIFTGRKDFIIRLIFTGRKDFIIRLIFTGRKHLYIFFSAYIFNYFSAFFIKYAPIF